MTIEDPIATRLVLVLEEHSKLLRELRQRLDAPVSPLAAERRLATLQEAMDLLGVRRSMVFRLVRQKKIVRVLEGRRARFDVESIERYNAERIAEAGGTVRRGPGRPRGQSNVATYELEAAKIAKLKP